MNGGVATLLEDTNLSLAEKTFAGCSAGLWRIGIMPIDTLKKVVFKLMDQMELEL